MAATAKNDTIESLVKTISELTTTKSALKATIKKLDNQLERAQSKSGQNEYNGASDGGASGGGASGGGTSGDGNGPVGATLTHTASPVDTNY